MNDNMDECQHGSSNIACALYLKRFFTSHHRSFPLEFKWNELFMLYILCIRVGSQKTSRMHYQLSTEGYNYIFSSRYEWVRKEAKIN